MEKNSLKDRLEEAAQICGSVAALARKSGVSETTIRAYVRGTSEPTASKLLAVSRASGLNPAWVLDGISPRQVTTIDQREHRPLDASDFVPIKGVTFEYEASDEPQLIQRLSDLRIAFDKKWLNARELDSSKLFLQAARDDSMSPSINPGDILLINGYYDTNGRPGVYPDDTFDQEGIFYVKPGQGKHAIRRVQPSPDGGFLLSTDNANRPDLNVPRDQLKLLGRVEWFGRNL